MTTRDGKLRNVRGAHPSALRNGARGGGTYGVSVDSGRPFVSHESLKKGACLKTSFNSDQLERPIGCDVVINPIMVMPQLRWSMNDAEDK